VTITAAFDCALNRPLPLTPIRNGSTYEHAHDLIALTSSPRSQEHTGEVDVQLILRRGSSALAAAEFPAVCGSELASICFGGRADPIDLAHRSLDRRTKGRCPAPD
jgi:hypothetical protein